MDKTKQVEIIQVNHVDMEEIFYLDWSQFILNWLYNIHLYCKICSVLWGCDKKNAHLDLNREKNNCYIRGGLWDQSLIVALLKIKLNAWEKGAKLAQLTIYFRPLSGFSFVSTWK